MVFYGLLDGNVVTVYISCIENSSLDILQNISFCVLQKKIWNNMWVSKWSQILHFLWTIIPLKAKARHLQQCVYLCITNSVLLLNIFRCWEWAYILEKYYLNCLYSLYHHKPLLTPGECRNIGTGPTFTYQNTLLVSSSLQLF